MKNQSLWTRVVLGVGASALFIFESWQHYGWVGPLVIASGVAVILVVVVIFGKSGSQQR